MDTLQIEAFLAIVQYGSLTEAANSLFISQSTFSHRLTELEREVGVRLIKRSRGVRSLTLTDYGAEFLAIAKRWENLVHDAKQIRSRANKPTLSIGAVDTFHTFFFPPLYQALRERKPAMNLRIQTHNSTELYLQVARGEIDVAFPLIDLPMKNIVLHKFYTEPRVLLRREMPPGICNELISPDRLDFAKEIFFEGDSLFHTWYEHWKGGKGYPLLQVDTAQLLLPLLNQEGAWAIVPLCIAQKVASWGSFAYYQLEDSPPKRICYKIQSRFPKASSLEGISILNSYLNTVFSDLILDGNKKN
ncbi:MAG: LysR family transcriptional regulator [Veillonellales bacterium]